MKEFDKEEHLVLSVMLLLITVLCLGFSFWSMTAGYESAAGNLFASAVFSLVIVLMLFTLNYRLRRGLMQGISGAKIAGLLGLYILVVMISFSGLFNKFYSTFMHTELIVEELNSKTRALNELKEGATSSLSNEDAEVLRQKVTALVKQLKIQILSPAEPGLGPKANSILNEIEALIKTKITRMPNKGTSESALVKLGNDYENLILGEDGVLNNSEVLAKLNAPEKRSYLKEVSLKIDPELKNLAAKNSELGVQDNEVTRANALEAIQRAVSVYNEVGQRTQSLVKEVPFSYDLNMRVENDAIGKISHTYRSAGAHLSHWGVWICVFLALAIDLIVPMFVFFLTPRGQNSGASFASKNKGAQVLKSEF